MNECMSPGCLRSRWVITAAVLLVQAGAMAQPKIVSLSHAERALSGRLLIFGSGFGTNQHRGRVLIGGADAIATTWGESEIHAYVPESAPLGSVKVRVVTDEGSSDAVPLDVTRRVDVRGGRVRWRFQIDSPFPGGFITVGPDGTIYASDISRLYALSPSGALLWVRGGVGGRRPISLAADGTIYTASNLVSALNPDGTVKWLFPNPVPGAALIAGPNVGPDGNIYAVHNVFRGGIGTFSLDPDGNLLWANDRESDSFQDSNSKILFGADRAYVSRIPSGAIPLLATFRLDGNLLWESSPRDRDLLVGTFPRLDPSGRIIVGWGQTGMQAITPDGSRDWMSLHPDGGFNLLMPGIGPDGAIYTTTFLSLRHWAINPDGSARWFLPRSSGITITLNVPPDGSIILVGGRDMPLTPAWLKAFDTADGTFLWQVDLPPEGGIQQRVMLQQPTFTPDSRTAYLATCLFEAGFGFLYAVDITDTPGSCPADIDGDGDADVADFFAFVVAFAAGDPAADVNGDGSIDVGDFFTFVAAFAVGCP